MLRIYCKPFFNLMSCFLNFISNTIRCITRTKKNPGICTFFICKMKLFRNKPFSLHHQVALFLLLHNVHTV